jgi:hypothetical protein
MTSARRTTIGRASLGRLRRRHQRCRSCVRPENAILQSTHQPSSDSGFSTLRAHVGVWTEYPS